MNQPEIGHTHLKNKIPIAFSVDDNYALYLAVTIKSILVNSSAENRYELIVLEENLSSSNKRLLASVIKENANFSIQFLNIASLTEKYGKNNLYTCFHFSPAIYYRLFLAEILPHYDKIIYLDSDLIIQKDIADLFDINIEDNYLAAGHEWICLLRSVRRYLNANLKQKTPWTTYFISGHIVMNLNQIRNANLLPKFISVLRQNKKFRTPDQDILNIVCQGKVIFLPSAWNFCWHWKDCISPRLLKKYHVYETGTNPPALIHYASAKKPWNTPGKELADLWWSYANQLPFKEEIHKKALEDRCCFLQKNYDMIVNSIPWKITKPLRELYDFLKYDVLEF